MFCLKLNQYSFRKLGSKNSITVVTSGYFFYDNETRKISLSSLNGRHVQALTFYGRCNEILQSEVILDLNKNTEIFLYGQKTLFFYDYLERITIS